MLTWTSHKVSGTSVKSLSKGAMQTEQIHLSAALCSTPEIPRLHISLVTISPDPPLITVSHTEFFFEWKPLNVTDVSPPLNDLYFLLRNSLLVRIHQYSSSIESGQFASATIFSNSLFRGRRMLHICQRLRGA